jgi:hypothetical protein
MEIVDLVVKIYIIDVVVNKDIYIFVHECAKCGTSNGPSMIADVINWIYRTYACKSENVISLHYVPSLL